jgi:hypothetical protein
MKFNGGNHTTNKLRVTDCKARALYFFDIEGDLIHILPLVNNLDLGKKLAESEEWH